MSSAQRRWSAEIADRVLRLLSTPETGRTSPTGPTGRAGPAGAATAVLAVDGPSGAGKTTLADEIVADLEARAPGTVALVRMEDLYPGWDGLRAATSRLAGEVLVPLLAGRPADYLRWDWATGTWGTRRDHVPARPLTVVEGVGAGTLAVAPMLTALVFVDAPEQVRHDRAMARDGATYRDHWERWARQERAYFDQERPAQRADATLLPGSFQPRGLG